MANWLEFKKIALWEYPVFHGFAYDHIPDDKIKAAVDHPLLEQVNVSLDWEDDEFLVNEQRIPEEDKHAFRVAALVKSFSSGQPMQESIELDTFSIGQCASCVPNGHHRVRALQYLGLTAGPFALSGSLDELEGLVILAGRKAPDEAINFVETHLMQTTEDDVLCEFFNEGEIENPCLDILMS